MGERGRLVSPLHLKAAPFHSNTSLSVWQAVILARMACFPVASVVEVVLVLDLVAGMSRARG
jgi:hypothetical protein